MDNLIGGLQYGKGKAGNKYPKHTKKKAGNKNKYYSQRDAKKNNGTGFNN